MVTCHLYQEVLKQAQYLSMEDQLRLIEDLAATIRQPIVAKPQHSILELEGLGKEIWESIDVDQYLEEERNSWNG